MQSLSKAWALEVNLNLINDDCMSVMRDYPDNYFDACITSPPYNMNLRINARGNGYCSRQIVKELSSKYKNFNDNLPMEKYEDFLRNYVQEMLRISSVVFLNLQIITGNKPALFRFFGHFADQIKELIIWDKCYSQPAIGDGVLNSRFELIVVLGGNSIARAFKNPQFKKGSLDNIWQIRPNKSKNAEHKASFPLELTQQIIKNFLPKSGKIIDPFLGTGTTGIAAYYAQMGEFVGVELDADYFSAAKARINQETKQVDMFAGVI